MKFILGKKKFTLMIIPGANERVIRLKLPQSTFIIVPVVICLVLIGFFLTVYLMKTFFKEETNQLIQQYEIEEKQLTEQITIQNNELHKLQLELIDFSEQTNLFKSKLEEIKKLDHVISMMTDPLVSKSANSGNPMDIDLPPTTGDVGGMEQFVTDEEWAKLLSETKSDLNHLIQNIEEVVDSLAASEEKLIEAQRLRDLTPTIWPSDSRKITSEFGIRKDPFTKKASMHTGIDLGGDIGDNVYAAATGEVIETGLHHDYGNYILIEHTQGIQTKYMHLSKVLVQKGDKMSKGEIIGLVGNTGRSTGPHLHYEVIKNGKQVNPQPYLISSRKEEMPDDE